MERIIKLLYILILYKLSELEFYLYPQKVTFFLREIYLKSRNFNFYKSSIRIGKSVYIKNDGNFIFGKRCCIGSYSKFWNYDLIQIGDDFLSAGNLTINTGSHEIESLKPISNKVIIGDRVWCGINVTILSGVKIGNDVIIGAGSVVNKDIEDGAIVVGVPAKKIKSIYRSNIVIHEHFRWIETRLK